jgi:hypothetical protein
MARTRTALPPAQSPGANKTQPRLDPASDQTARVPPHAAAINCAATFGAARMGPHPGP